MWQDDMVTVPSWEYQYLNIMSDILRFGEVSTDRTGVGTKSIFDVDIRVNLAAGFPAITTKKLAFNSMVAENLWFLEGSSDERRLAEIQYGTRDASKKTIWTANANADYWKPKAAYDGDLGRVYGEQLRFWRTVDNEGNIHLTDQVQNLLTSLKSDPYSRRHILLNYNPGELDDGLMALPACHMMSQYYVRNNTLSCKVYIRSNDMFLGNPFNVSGYALMTHIFAHLSGMKVGTLTLSIGDAHIYLNHVKQVEEQLTRVPHQVPSLWVDPAVTSLEQFTLDSFKLVNYTHDSAISAPMAV
jgi:thymidylate synthase